MALATNALTTIETARMQLKLYSYINSNIDEVLVVKQNSLNKVFNFAHTRILQDNFIFSETLLNITTDITSDVASIDYTLGQVTFNTSHGGVVKVMTYKYLKFDYSKDFLLERKINVYSDWVEHALGRKLGKTNYVEKYHGNNRQYLVLNQFPIVNINSIKINDAIIDASLYEVTEKDKSRGLIFAENGWAWDGYLAGLVGEPMASIRNIVVNYDAGYNLPNTVNRDLPYDLEDFTLALIALDYSKHGIQGLESYSVSDVSWKWNNQLSKQYDIILEHYKTRRV